MTGDGEPLDGEVAGDDEYDPMADPFEGAFDVDEFDDVLLLHDSSRTTITLQRLR